MAPGLSTNFIFQEPRSLKYTEQKWHTDSNGAKVYNEPEKTGATLDSKQGKVPGFVGTCGLCSCVNVLRLAGCNISEPRIVEFASQNRLCVTNKRINANGGTSYHERQVILKAFGIDSESKRADAFSLAGYVSQGRGAIISVDAGKLYNRPTLRGKLHAVTVTSVKTNAHGEVTGFFVCDSNGQPAAYYSYKHIENALSGSPMNITKSVIR